MNRKLGAKINSLRIDRSYTQEQVAEYLGMSRQKYARIEKGINDITLDILVKISNFFEVEISDITSVLEQKPAVAYRNTLDEKESINVIHEMLDLFYANKHAYDRLTYKDEV